MPCNGAAKADCTGSKTAIVCRAVNSLPGLLLAGLVLFGFGGHTLFLGVRVLATGVIIPEDEVHNVYYICYYTFLGLNLLMLERALSFKVGVRYPNLIPAPLYVPLPRRLKAPIFAVCLCYCTLLLILGLGVFVGSLFLLIGDTLIALPALMIDIACKSEYAYIVPDIVNITIQAIAEQPWNIEVQYPEDMSSQALCAGAVNFRSGVRNLTLGGILVATAEVSIIACFCMVYASSNAGEVAWRIISCKPQKFRLTYHEESTATVIEPRKSGVQP